MYFAADDQVRVRGDDRLGSELDAESQSLASVALQPRIEADFPAGEVWRECQPIDACSRNLFEPHGLPDTGRARIPDGVRLQPPVLLAARLGEILRVIFRPDDN